MQFKDNYKIKMEHQNLNYMSEFITLVVIQTGSNSGVHISFTIILQSFKMGQLPVLGAIMPVITDCKGGTDYIWQRAEFRFFPNSQMQLISQE